MVVSPNIAARAYAQALERIALPAAPSAAQQSGPADFGSVLEAAAVNTVNTGKAAEGMTAQALVGKADINDVVMAVNAADISLQSVIAVRDRVIAAYQEIMRMPI